MFIPDGIHEQVAATTVEELKIASASLDDVTVEKVKAFTDLERFQLVIFPNLDMHPRKTRHEYSAMCGNLFRSEPLAASVY